MLGVRLLPLLFFRGGLISAGTWTGDTTDSDNESSLQSFSDKGWCSTWGAGHFSTFDHHEYDFTGMCNYIFTATCKDASPTFSIQMRRGPDGNISRIIIELGASVVTVNKAVISVRDIGVVSLPYTSNGLQITPYGQSMRLVAKQLELELVVMWGPDDYLMEEQGGAVGAPGIWEEELEVPPAWMGNPFHTTTGPNSDTLQVLMERKYMDKLCGLCGNFDGKTDNEFLSEDGKLLESHKYATLQKLDDPNEICAHEAIPKPTVLQTKYAKICTQLLTLVAPECDVPKEPLVLSCQADMAACDQPGQQNCSCATLSEYSRRCSTAGQPVHNWRSPRLCPLGQCPANQVYQECGEACVRTCSNPQHSCSSFCTFGCFCPDGTLLDDVSRNHTCVPVSQCPCMLNGVIYGPGEVTRTACQTCQCTMGHWTCTERPCPGHCSLEGGSFVTTFDARPYRFHGTCTYVLLQSPQLPNEGTLMAVYDKSGYSHSETSLMSVIYLSKKDKIVISEDEVITNNGDTKLLPYKTHNITIFRQTSTHLQMTTTFGLELVIQLQPVFQVYITVGPQFRGQTRGLCGNFNGDTKDDFTTSMGIDEGTASLFVDSWRAGNCPTALERETDPCSMSQLNKVCAETHCSMLLKKGNVFEKCHTVVNPQPFYKRCVYQACNYEETFPHICSALGAYAHACSSRGIVLWGWRSSVDNCTVPCTGNRTFSYDSQACDRTCLSLSDRGAECYASAVPVDGCNCPEGTYLNHKGECVRKTQCPCLLDGYKLVQADQSTMINGVICYCINGRLNCPRQAEMFLASCPEPKTFQSCSQSSEDKFGAACAPTCQMLATGIACVPTKCESGCACPKGLYEDSNGQCVPAEECPCEFSGVSYPGGAELHTDCKTCTCSHGSWTCQQSAQCPSTCVLYGEGHIITFDGQRFVFDGNCEYTLATDDCGTNSSQPTFKVLTENVICGKSGVTCSRAIKIFTGGLSITMADRNYTVSGEEPLVHLQVKPSPLNLVLDMSIPGRFNLTLVWNKHMSISIKIQRDAQDALCGLCGNSNGNMKDDFETRSKYVASSELEFVNSWKESPLCGDVSYVVEPCSQNTFRLSWAERKCSIINSQTFAACHSKVYHLPYYEACVRDTCGCDTGGDCECLCDAVAAYAKACLDKGVCVDWRAPDFCPIYCGFYNTHTLVGENEYQYMKEANCTWHYQPCLCPGSLENFLDTNIEGCYNCSQNEYFDHSQGTCVPCAPPTTTLAPTTTGTQPTMATSTTTGLHSFSSPATSSTVTATATPVVQTSPTTNSSPQTSLTTHLPTSVAVSATPYTTEPPTTASIQTTTTLPTTQTSFSTTVPTYSTSSVTPTSEIILTPTSPHTASSASTSRTLSTHVPTTTVEVTKPTHTATPLTSTTSSTTQIPSSFPTDRTSPHLTHPSSAPIEQSTSFLASTLSTKSTVTATATPIVHPSTYIPSSPDISLSTHPPPSVVVFSTPHTSSSPMPHVSSVVTAPQQPSTASLVSTSPLFTESTASHLSSVPAFVSPTAHPSPFPSSVFPTITSPVPTIHMSPSPSSLPASSTSLPSTLKTTPGVSISSSISSQSTTSLFTSLTTQALTSGLLSSTLGMTVLPSSPDTNHTTRPPKTSVVSTSVLLSSPPNPTGSVSPSAEMSPSSADSWVSSPPASSGTCSLREEEQQITYQGCVANVTLTHCEGFCASSVSLNTDTQQLETRCGCCQPLGVYEKQLLLPCPDPNVPGQQLTLTLQVFSSCTCRSLQCRE
ncbi:mucin-6 [Nannospalax galili]|nr:mucin-6 [Nannospalax galili]